MTHRTTPLGAVVRGAAAGLAGTAAMDLLWYSRYRQSGGEDSFVDWEFSASLKDWENAPAPAQVGRCLFEGLFQRELPAEAAAFTNNVTHWGTGLGWGALYGVVAGSLTKPKVRYGLALGPAAWLASYAVLPLAKLYRPIWDYDTKTLGRDLSAHAAFGVGTSVAFRALRGRRVGRLRRRRLVATGMAPLRRSP